MKTLQTVETRLRLRKRMLPLRKSMRTSPTVIVSQRRASLPLAALMALVLITSTGAVPPILAQTPFWAELAEPGPHAVGLRVLDLKDASRPYRDQPERPLPTWIWYPAEQAEDRLTYGRYVEHMADEGALGDVGEAARRGRLDRWIARMEDRRAGLGQEMASLNVAAAENAPAAEGPFPLVIYVPGSGGSALENVALAELLASRGYVVAAIPSLGAAYRTAYTMLRDLTARARDVRFAVGEVAKLDVVDRGRVVVVGWSMGGLAGMLAQMRDSRIGGLVSLDGGIGVHRQLAQRATGFSPSRARVPYLLLDSGDQPDATPGFFEDLHYSDAYYMSIDGAGHADFSTRWGYLANKAREGSSDFDPDVLATYGTVLHAVVAFMDHATGAVPDGADDRILALGATPGTEVRRRQPAPAPPPTYRFLELLEEDPFQAREIYRTAKAVDPTVLIFEEEDLVQHAFRLFNRLNRPDDAVEIGRLLVEAFPDSYSAHGYLAELHRKNEEWVPALVEFSTAHALASREEDEVWTPRQDALDYYRQMIDELKARLSDR